MKHFIIALVVLAAIAGLGTYLYFDYKHEQAMMYPQFYSGNGRLEATEVFVATRLGGKIDKIFVKEGDLVRKGDKLVQMDTSTLEAMKEATLATIKEEKGNIAVAKATVKIKRSVFDGAAKAYNRQKALIASRASSQKDFEKAETEYNSAVADFELAEAKVLAAEGKLLGAQAELKRINVDIRDSLLIAAYDGRIQYLLAHEGEVLSVGGRAMNLVNLTDTYMTFFLPTKIAGQVKLGAEVKIVLDAAPDYPVDAKVTYIDPVAQFTPKSVETKREREKLMFRIKAGVNAELVRKYIEDVKTGLPGVAWVKLDPEASWKNAPVSLGEYGAAEYEDRAAAKKVDAAAGKEQKAPAAAPQTK